MQEHFQPPCSLFHIHRCSPARPLYMQSVACFNLAPNMPKSSLIRVEHIIVSTSTCGFEEYLGYQDSRVTTVKQLPPWIFHVFPSAVHKKLTVSEKAPTRDLLLAIETSNSNNAVGEPDAYLISVPNQHLKQERTVSNDAHWSENNIVRRHQKK